MTNLTVDIGYSGGSLHYIGPFKEHPGLLLSLVPHQYSLNKDDDPYPFVIVGVHHLPPSHLALTHLLSYQWDKVRFFDLETEQFYEQRTDFPSDSKLPASRQLFCSVLVRDEEANTWDLWIYGGASLIDPKIGFSDIWVLTMPGFM